MYWSTILDHLSPERSQTLMTPSAILTQFGATPRTVVGMTKTPPVLTHEDLTQKQCLMKLMCIEPLTEQHVTSVYHTVRCAIAMLSEDIPKATYSGEGDEFGQMCIGRIPGSCVKDGMQDALNILKTLVETPVKCMIEALNRKNIAILDGALDGAWDFQENHTCFAAPSVMNSDTWTLPHALARPDENVLGSYENLANCLLTKAT